MPNLRDLSHVYASGTRALDRVTLPIPRGMYGLPRPDCAGKSTLMRTVRGLAMRSFRVPLPMGFRLRGMGRAFTLLAAVGAGANACRAQSYDPAAASPLILLAAPEDGVAYYEARQRAGALLAEGTFAEAEPLAERLVREYPRDGENWLLLGRARAGLEKHAEAATAFERAGPLLGWRSPYHLAGVNAAINHLAAGDPAAALEELRREVFERRNFYLRSRAHDWPQFAPLRDDPAFLELVARPDTAGWTREEGWRWDLAHLYAEVQRVNPDYHAAPFPPEFDRRYAELVRRVPELSDEELLVGMGAMLAVLNQGHTAVFPPARNLHLPVQLYSFPEGIFIVDAREGYEGLVGARLVTIEGTPAEEVFRRLSEARNVEGDMQHVWGVSELASVFHLRGVGASRARDSAAVEIERPDEPLQTVLLPALPGTPSRRQDKLLAPRGVTAPLFLRDSDQAHWELALPEHDALYVQVNQVRPDPEETVPQFGRRLRTVLAEIAPANLILDLRHNNGGDTFSYTELLRTLVGYALDPDRRLYVLIGRRTYSATANLITDLERLANPVFVGEASSACCSFYGDPNRVVLPYSGVTAEVTAAKWNLSYDVFDGRREMSPDVPVQLTARAYFAGRDPALEAVFRLIARRSGG